jgi:hypothetical protein
MARLHYYLTRGREFLPDREKQVMEKQLNSGFGSLFLPDTNRSLLGGKIKVLEALDILRLLQPDMEWTNTSPFLVELSIMCRQHAFILKSVLGISIKENDTPIQIAQKILRQCLGLSFQAPIKRGAKGNQQRCYPSVQITPLRQKILEAWSKRDAAAKEAKAAAKVALNSLSSSVTGRVIHKEAGEQGEGEQGDKQKGIVPHLNANHSKEWGIVTHVSLRYTAGGGKGAFPLLPAPFPPASCSIT